MKKSVVYRRKFECKLKRKKNKCRSIYKFSALDFVATEAKKMAAKGKKYPASLEFRRSLEPNVAR